MVHAFSFRLEILTEMNNTVLTVYTKTFQVCRGIYQTFTFKTVNLHLLRILMIIMHWDYNHHFSIWVKHQTLQNFQSRVPSPLNTTPSPLPPTLPTSDTVPVSCWRPQVFWSVGHNVQKSRSILIIKHCVTIRPPSLYPLSTKLLNRNYS